jgi:predicted NAD/FAD-binding protein
MARIAIIGTGISGMAAAYALKTAGHAITVYEKSSIIGGHTRTRTIDYDGVTIAVDTGFIVYNIPNYPHLSALFAHLDVPVQKSNMSFAISVDHGRLEWGARSLNAVFGQRRNLLRPSFYRLIRDVMRFNRDALALVEQFPELSLGELIDRLQLGQDFRRYYLLPMGGAIWSCPPKTMLEFPAKTFVQFFKNHGLLSTSGQPQWYTVTGGSQNYIKKITASYRDDIRTDCAAVRVTRNHEKVQVTDSRGDSIEYDRVVFACHADQTVAMLADISPEEASVLSAFRYQTNIAYLHRDINVMPKRTACWASWVYQAGRAEIVGDEPQIAVTYWMNLLQSIDQRKPLFVTLNPLQPIAEHAVFDRHVFEHPVFTREAIAAQAKIPALQGVNNSWFCGAYTRYGFHEDGLLSAANVVESMGEKLPWQ